ncbi:MAG: hypothetical protein M3Z19_00435 [Chloroflexota bacterium]|nr:hypothetical protein [Chloroflexota bacterium]
MGSLFLVVMAVVLVMLVAALVLQVLASSHSDEKRARQMNNLGRIGLLSFMALEVINPDSDLVWRMISFASFVLLLVVMFIGYQRKRRRASSPRSNWRTLE